MDSVFLAVLTLLSHSVAAHQLISQWRLALPGSTEVFTAIGEIDYVSMKQHRYYTLYIIYGTVTACVYSCEINEPLCMYYMLFKPALMACGQHVPTDNYYYSYTNVTVAWLKLVGIGSPERR